jgi:hypothetical protein
MSEEPFDPATVYRWSLAPEDRARLPYYDKLVDALAGSEVACDLLVETRPEQRNPMLVLAALRLGALRGDEFASRVVARLEARPQLVRGELHRATQTNEPGRSAVTAAVLRELVARGVTDIHPIDVGTSMGLNLYPDRYRVNVDDPSDPTVLTMDDLNGNVRDGPLPSIHQRIGIDLNPLDPNEPEDVLWLEACLWPEEPHRLARFKAILERAKHWPEATRLEGRATALIDEVVASCPPAATPVIFHSWVAAYFPVEEQVRWRQQAMRHVANGAVWVYLEYPPLVAGLRPPKGRSERAREGGSQIVVAEPGAEPRAWGWAHPHGRWIALAPDDD